MIKNRLRPFVLFFSLLVSLIITTALVNAGITDSAAGPDQEDQLLARTVASFDLHHTSVAQGSELESPSSVSSVAQNMEFVGQIGGAPYAVAVQGNYAFVGEGPRLTILNVKDPSSLVVLGKTPLFSEMVRGVAVAENYAYVSALGGGLHIIDISNLADPTEIGFFNTPGTAWCVAVAGDYAFIADGTRGLRIIDVSDPANPSESSYYEMPGYAYCVAVEGNFAYVAAGDSGLRIIDVSDPANPVEIGFYNTSISANHVFVDGNLAYIAAGTGGLRIIDVSIPVAPTEVGNCDIPGDGANRVAVVGSKAYVAAGNQGLRIIDVTFPSSPAEIGFGNPRVYAYDVAGDRSYAFVADGYGLHIFDVANPATPTVAGFYDTPGSTKGVIIDGDYAYIADGGGRLYHGLRIIDISNPASPTETGYYNTQGTAYGVALAEKYAYVADLYGLKIIDVSNPAAPAGTGYYNTPGLANDVAVAGNFAYVADRAEGLRIIDISESAAPIEVGHYDTPGYAFGVAVDGNYAYVANGEYGLRIIDVSNQASPTERGFYDTPGFAYGVTVDGNYAYVADGGGSRLYGLRIIDVSDPADPAEIGYYDSPNSAWAVTVDGNYAYVADGNGGLRIVNVANPNAPNEAGFFDTPWHAVAVAVAGNYVYVADGEGGLLILRHIRPVMDVDPDRINLSGNPGDTLRTTITVLESGDKAGIKGINLSVTDLTDDADNTIPDDTVSFNPGAFDLSAGGSKEVTMSVPLPGDLSTGEYSGSVTVESLDAGTISIPITIDVQPDLGSITIKKRTDPTGSTSFGFNGDLGNFSLKGGKSKDFADLSADDYTVDEAKVTGWYLDRVECDSENVSYKDDGVTIHLQAGQDVTCTFRNRRLSAKADAGGPYSGKEGTPIALDAMGTSNKEIVALYKWDCTADGTYDETSSSPTASACTYADNGKYTIKLQTVDIFDEKSTDTAQVTVDNVAPLVNAGEDRAVIAGAEVPFAGTFSDPGKADTHTIEWNFGDGNKASGSLTPKHIFANTGKYTVKLSVTDDDGDSDSDELTVDVFNSVPKLSDLKVSPEEIDEGGSFTLAGLMSDASTDSVLTLEIDWGDGQSQTKEFAPGSSKFSLNHSCADDDPSGTGADSYTIKLKLMDDEGAYSTGTAVFKVKNVAPAVDAGADKAVIVGENVKFNATITDPGVPDSHTVTWDFGDGSPLKTGVNAAHTFNKTGGYVVTVTVEDDDGGAGRDTVNVIVIEDKNIVHLPLLMKP